MMYYSGACKIFGLKKLAFAPGLPDWIIFYNNSIPPGLVINDPDWGQINAFVNAIKNIIIPSDLEVFITLGLFK